MAKTKFYAVKVGRIPNIYTSWEEAKKEVEGFKGAKYKSFKTLEDAERYLYTDTDQNKENINDKIERKIKNIKSNEIIAFVDGSYSDSLKKYSFGAVIITNKNIKEKYMSFDNEKYAESRNVAGEVIGVIEVLKEVETRNKDTVYIYYDYEGIEKWITGEWKAKKDLTKWYRDTFQSIKTRNNLKVEFNHTKAHSGIKYNELADGLAKRALGII